MSREKKGSLSLKRWFDSSKSSKTGAKGWVQVGGRFDGYPCARQEGQTTTPKCRSSSEASRMSKKEKQYAFKKKQREDPSQPEKSGGAKPTMVKTYKNQNESLSLQEIKDACYYKVKSRYKVWPSAYASGALAKCRKKGASNWGTKTEEAPANAVGGGNVAGLGVGSQGEPGRPKQLMPMARRGKFAQYETFIVSSKTYNNIKQEKKKGKHWRTYLEEDDSYHDLREYAKKHKGPIVVEDERTGACTFVRYN